MIYWVAPRQKKTGLVLLCVSHVFRFFESHGRCFDTKARSRPCWSGMYRANVRSSHNPSSTKTSKWGVRIQGTTASFRQNDSQGCAQSRMTRVRKAWSPLAESKLLRAGSAGAWSTTAALFSLIIKNRHTSNALNVGHLKCTVVRRPHTAQLNSDQCPETISSNSRNRCP